MSRMLQANVIATSGRAVEAAGDVDVLLLDKTGTITLGNRQACAFIPAPGVTEEELANAAQFASLADETPEGRSIVVLAKQRFNVREREIGALGASFVPFTAQTRMSGVDMAGRQIRKGAAQAIRTYLEAAGAHLPEALSAAIDEVSRRGSTPLVVAEKVMASSGVTDMSEEVPVKKRGRKKKSDMEEQTQDAQVSVIAPETGDFTIRALGVIELKDIVKGGIKERFAQLRKMGIKTVMVTGDNRLTAAAIAAEAGVDDFLAEATPEAKLVTIRDYQAQGKLVAMTGDGTNDAPALAQADVAVAMNT
ncbi:hypothetical protein BGZ81_011523, partial [Podila clonocystis]